jgi:hypothetical protein
MSKRAALPILAGVCLVALSAAPAFAGEATAPPAPVPEVATPVAPAPAGCGLNLELIDPAAEVGICPAVAPQEAPAPEFLSRPPRLRTCVCSCGYPCTTDADCGPGGVCGPGITCC